MFSYGWHHWCHTHRGRTITLTIKSFSNYRTLKYRVMLPAATYVLRRNIWKTDSLNASLDIPWCPGYSQNIAIQTQHLKKNRGTLLAALTFKANVTNNYFLIPRNFLISSQVEIKISENNKNTLISVIVATCWTIKNNKYIDGESTKQ